MYSTNSNNRKEFEYDSLDINNRAKLRDIYTNPAIATNNNAATKPRGNNKSKSDDYEVVNVSERPSQNGSGHFDNSQRRNEDDGHQENVAGVYINNDYTDEGIWQGGGENGGDEVSGDEEEPKNYEYSAAGERMLISISGDNESVYSNKILISVNNHGSSSSHSPPPPHQNGKPLSNSGDMYFDPDTLERSNFGRPQRGQEYRSNSTGKNIHKLRVSSNYDEEPAPSSRQKGSFYLFNEGDRKELNNPQGSGHVNSTPLRSLPGNTSSGLQRSSQLQNSNNFNQQAIDRPSLPPKMRGMPKLPPKPIVQNSLSNSNTSLASTGTPPRMGQRPLPPPPPPPPGN